MYFCHQEMCLRKAVESMLQIFKDLIHFLLSCRKLASFLFLFKLKELFKRKLAFYLRLVETNEQNGILEKLQFNWRTDESADASGRSERDKWKAYFEMRVGCGEEELPLDKVDLVGAALLSCETHGGGRALGVGKVTADDQRVSPQVVVEAEHHRVA